MSNYDGAIAALFLVFLIAVFVILLLSIWWAAGMFCAAFGFYAVEQNAQILMFIVLMLMLGSKVR